MDSMKTTLKNWLKNKGCGYKDEFYLSRTAIQGSTI